MPPIHRYACNQCDFELPSGMGGYTYAVDKDGQRVECPHPLEFHTIHQVTGMEYSEACEAGRAGCAQHCVCLNCLHQFDLDLERDAVVCPACASSQVRSLRDLVGKQCPRCKAGVIEEGSVVRWRLDPDWKQLPVPQVVRDLTEFEEHRRVPDSLQAAAAAAGGFGKPGFLTVALQLLSWWEGNFFSEDGEQKECTEMQRQWTWCNVLPEVLQAAPALAELVVIRKGRCCFAETVTPEVRRGIKNHLRKHRKHVIWT